MLRFLVPLFLTAYTGRPAAAQTQTGAVAGSYRLNQNHEPEGGTRLFLFPNHRYTVVYFGGAEAGNWSLKQDSLLFLTRTDLPARPFTLYARHNPALGTRARFFAGGGFEDATSYVAFAGLTRPGTLQPVFNPDANCFSFPYVDTLAAIPDSLSFAQQVYDDVSGEPKQGPVYTFPNRERCNDFIAGFYPEWIGTQQQAANGEPFATVRPGGLFLFRSGFLSERGGLSLSAEDSAFLVLMQAQSPDPDTVLFNPRYKGLVPEPGAAGSLDGYTYRPDKAAFVSGDYVENAEAGDAFNFNDVSILYPFRAMREASEAHRLFRVAPGSVFNATCR